MRSLLLGGVALLAMVLFIASLFPVPSGDASERELSEDSCSVPLAAARLASPLVMWQQTLEEDVREVLEADERQGEVRLRSPFVDDFLESRVKLRRSKRARGH